MKDQWQATSNQLSYVTRSNNQFVEKALFNVNLNFPGKLFMCQSFQESMQTVENAHNFTWGKVSAHLNCLHTFTFEINVISINQNPVCPALVHVCQRLHTTARTDSEMLIRVKNTFEQKSNEWIYNQHLSMSGPFQKCLFYEWKTLS